MCQWSFDRKEQLFEYAESKGVEWKDLNMQLEFFSTELTGDGAAKGYATYQIMNKKGFTKEDFENATSPEAAAEAFCWIFERPSEKYAHVDRRKESAKKYYGLFKRRNMPVGTGGVIPGGDNKYSMGQYLDSQGHMYTLWRQSNYTEHWFSEGTISTSGCGISSCSIVMSGLLNDPTISPLTVYEDSGIRSTAMQPLITYLNSKGLKTEATYELGASDKYILEKLRSGYDLIVNVVDGNVGGYHYDGHYYTIVDINANNQVFVIDPAPTKYSNGNNQPGGGNNGWYNIEQLTSKKHIIYVKK